MSNSYLNHVGDQLYNCDKCNLVFEKAPELAKHLMVHAGECPFSCTWQGCNKKFKHRQSLKRHIVVMHMREFPAHKCQYCDRKFKRSDHLKVHLRFHTGEQPYACEWPGCGKKTKSKKSLDAHISRQHAGESLRYSCEVCDISWVTEYGLTYHLSRYHHGRDPRKKVGFFETPEQKSEPRMIDERVRGYFDLENEPRDKPELQFLYDMLESCSTKSVSNSLAKVSASTWRAAQSQQRWYDHQKSEQYLKDCVLKFSLSFVDKWNSDNLFIYL